MILYTTIGSEYANSYITVNEAIEILLSIGMELPWIEADAELQEYTLVVAASLIGMLPLRGNRVVTEVDEENGIYPQALDFPRDIQLDVDVIPEPVQEAQAILAATVVFSNISNLISKYTDNEPDGYTMDSLIESGAIESISIGGVFTVKIGGGSRSTVSSSSLNNIEAIPLILGLPVYMRMKPYLSQFRGGVIGDA